MPSILDVEIPQKFSADITFQKFVEEKCSFLATGTSRKVYSVSGGEYVVKVAIDHNHATCNWIEIASFLNFESDRSKLARIDSWSLSGKFLIMENLDMTSTPTDSFSYPAWVTDRKDSNIGKSCDGHYKICDYALFNSPDCAYKSEFV